MVGFWQSSSTSQTLNPNAQEPQSANPATLKSAESRQEKATSSQGWRESLLDQVQGAGEFVLSLWRTMLVLGLG